MLCLSPNIGQSRVMDVSLWHSMKPIFTLSCQCWGCPAAQGAILGGKYSHTFKVQETQEFHYGVHDVALRQGPINAS